MIRLVSETGNSLDMELLANKIADVLESANFEVSADTYEAIPEIDEYDDQPRDIPDDAPSYVEFSTSATLEELSEAFAQAGLEGRFIITEADEEDEYGGHVIWGPSEVGVWALTVEDGEGRYDEFAFEQISCIDTFGCYWN